MKIRGHECELGYEAKFRSPYPVVKNEIVVDGVKADFVIATGECRYTIDGKSYSGEVLICLRED